MMADVITLSIRPMRLIMLPCPDRVTNYHVTMLQAIFSVSATYT